MATDDLFAPLGQDKKPARARLTPSIYPVAAGLLGLALATFVVWVMVGHDPFGGAGWPWVSGSYQAAAPNTTAAVAIPSAAAATE